MSKKILTPPQGEVGKAEIEKIIDSLKNVANGIAGLNSAAQLNLAQIPLLPASQLGFVFVWEKVASVSESWDSGGYYETGSGNITEISILGSGNLNFYYVDLFKPKW